jgi:hypothetical protein
MKGIVMFDNSFINRVFFKGLCALLLPACVLWGIAASAAAPASPAASFPAPELPHQWKGQPLRPLAASEVEQRFARHFPGTVARMTDERDVLVVRTVHRPTRMLHPAADCYRAIGFRIGHQQLQQDGERRLWRCFDAARGGQHLKVCESIVDAEGRVYTDASAWYWGAVLGQSTGPWQSVTVASPL